MVVYNKIQYDARVIRAAESIASLNEKVCVLSCNSDLNYINSNFTSITYQSKKRGASLLITFWIYVIKTCIRDQDRIKMLYMHDYFMPYIGYFISKLIKKDWVYDAHELLIQRKTHIYSKRDLFFLLLEKYSIKKAALVIAANPERETIIRRIYNLKNTTSILNIPGNIDTCIDINKENTIVYQGTMSEERQVSNYIKRMQYLPQNIKLKLIGDGPDMEMYKSMVTQLGLEERVIFTGKIPYKDLARESKPCKIGIVSYLMDDLNNYYCSPNKLYEYAQLNLSVLVSPQPFLQKIVRKYQIGEILYENSTDKEYCDIVIKILENYDKYIDHLKKFLSDFSYEREMNKLKEKIKQLINNESSI